MLISFAALLVQAFLLPSAVSALPSIPESAIQDLELPSRLSARNQGNWTSLADNTTLNLQLGDDPYNCDGLKYRRDLKITSCEDAVSRIPKFSRDRLRFAVRGYGQYEVAIPYRYISFDGLCTIDIVTKDGIGMEKATMQEVSGAANTLLRRCVKTNRSGGIAMDLGLSGNLGLIMTSYQPSVQCRSGPAPPMGNCQHLADTMMTSKQHKTWGPRNDPKAYIQLPKELYETDRQCEAVIKTTTGATDVSTFYEMWEAVIAVNGMCVRFGQTGTALWRGNRRQLSLSLELQKRSSTDS